MAKRKIWTNAGAPTSGTSGTFVNLAEAGDVLVDTTGARMYVNTGTKGSPTWSDSVARDSADDAVVGVGLVLHRIAIAAGALADKNVVLTHKTRVIDAWLVLTGAGVASTTLQVKNGATAITDAMAASGADKAVVRCATIDDAQHEIAAAGTLRVTSASGATQPNAIVYVLGVRVA